MGLVKVNTIKRKFAFEILMWMNGHIERLPAKTAKGEDMCKWNEPWNDQAVAEKFKTSQIVIRNLRLETFGHLNGAVPMTTPIEERMSKVETYLTNLDPNWQKAQP